MRAAMQRLTRLPSVGTVASTRSPNSLQSLKLSSANLQPQPQRCYVPSWLLSLGTCRLDGRWRWRGNDVFLPRLHSSADKHSIPAMHLTLHAVPPIASLATGLALGQSALAPSLSAPPALAAGSRARDWQSAWSATYSVPPRCRV